MIDFHAALQIEFKSGVRENAKILSVISRDGYTFGVVTPEGQMNPAVFDENGYCTTSSDIRVVNVTNEGFRYETEFDCEELLETWIFNKDYIKQLLINIADKDGNPEDFSMFPDHDIELRR